jgi:hypothetical protein
MFRKSFPYSPQSGAASKRIWAAFDTCELDLHWVVLLLPTELIEQPLVLSLLTVSHEQKRPASPKK